MADSEGSIGVSLVKSALSGGAAEIAGDVAELALDAALDQGVLKDVPVFGWLFKAYGITATIKERIFLNKVAKFLHATAAVSDLDRETFREKLSADLEFCRKVGENLVLLLDRHDNIDKAHILGRVFSGYLRGEIDYDSFLKIASAVDRATISDLKRLEEHYRKMQSYDPKAGEPFASFLDDETSQSLYTAGLVRSEGYIEDTYHPNETGSQLIRLMNQ
ncbi:MAG: hypothetical protein WBN82_09030 [Porticoccaceae bacterium]